MKKQSGSAHVIIVVVLVVALLGTLGFIFWQNFLNKKTDTETPDKEAFRVVTKDKQDKPEVAKPQENTLAIKQYGVKFKLPASLNSTTVIYESRQIGEASFIALTTQRVVDLGGDCAKGYPFGDLVTLSRGNESSTNQHQVYRSEKIDGYYYHIGTIETTGLDPKSTCTSNAQARQDLAAIVAGLKTLTSED